MNETYVTLVVTVVCWRQLAENVAASCAKGDPVVVTGRLRVRQWTADDGRTGTAVELEAQTAGHDLARGTTVVTRTPPRVADRPARSDADELAEQVSREPVDEAAAADAATVAAAPTTPAERGRSVRHGTRPRSVEPAA